MQRGRDLTAASHNCASLCHPRSMAGDDSSGQAREMKAVYAFRGFDAELEATLPLLPDERVITQGRSVAGFRRVDVVLLMWELPGGRTGGVRLLPRALRLPITPSLPDSADELLARVVAWRDGSESEG
jgi:hypothetical protein